MNPVSTSKGIGFVGKVYSDGSYGYCRAKKTYRMGTEDFRHKYLSAQRELEGLYTKEEYQAATLARLAWKERSALGSSMVANSHKSAQPRAKRGSKGLTSHGRRQVFGGASFLEWRCGRQNLSFLTLTLPDFDPVHNPAIAGAWSELIRQFTQWLRRKLNDSNLLDWIVSATEVQEKRFKRTKCLALHQHLVFTGRRSQGDWSVTPRQVRKAWMAIVCKQLPMFSNCDFNSCENLQMVRRSVGGYLAKYLSKGTVAVGDVDAAPEPCHPSAWYSTSRALRRVLHTSTRTSRDAISATLNAPGEASFYHRSVRTRVADGLEIIVGAFGKFKPGWSKFIPAPIHPSVPLAIAPSVCGSVPRKLHEGFSYMF